MGSLGGEGATSNKSMWVCPKINGAKPSERWGHSACYFNGSLYIFGGCRGGVHFSDVLVCNLTAMTWNILRTSGQGPGPRDSHSAVILGHKMVVFGGTNGSKKVNDLHMLDLVSREWTCPDCCGSRPSARESHSAYVVDEKMVIFGGSGEGGANYLNDVHVLDLKSMEWWSPEIRGSVPAPRDSHSSVAVGNRLFVFGGDSGDRYQGDVCVLDMNKMVWSRVDTCGSSPGARAGHAAVTRGTKIYIVGGVGDKQYYNDTWVLDVVTSAWVQLDIGSLKSQGRFSHTASVTNLGIAIFGGCGEDERPLNELLILQTDSLACKSFGNMHKEETEIFMKKQENNTLKAIFVSDDEDLASPDVEELQFVPKQSFRFSSDMLHPKRRRTSNSKVPEGKANLQDHTLLQPQQSSSSQSDYEQTPAKKSFNDSCPPYRIHPLFRQKNSGPSCYPNNNASVNETGPKHAIATMSQDIYSCSDHLNPIKQEHANMACNNMCRPKCKVTAESLSVEARKTCNLVGAEVHGQVDGEFDSGYLMTATVNGKVFRGVLFAPGPDVLPRSTVVGECAVSFSQNHTNSMQGHSNHKFLRHHSQQPMTTKLLPPAGSCHVLSEQTQSRRSSPENQARLGLGGESRANSELQGIVLTLASPGSNHGGSRR